MADDLVPKPPPVPEIVDEEEEEVDLWGFLSRAIHNEKALAEIGKWRTDWLEVEKVQVQKQHEGQLQVTEKQHTAR